MFRLSWTVSEWLKMPHWAWDLGTPFMPGGAFTALVVRLGSRTAVAYGVGQVEQQRRQGVRTTDVHGLGGNAGTRRRG